MTTGFLFDLTLEKPGAPKFSIGISSASRPLHAVKPRENPETWVSALCGSIATTVPTWGEFSRSNDHIARRELCPECSWEVALEHGTAAIELAHRRPRDAYLEALGRALPDPLLYQRVIERLLQLGDENEVEHHTAAGVLGHLTRHAPVVLSYEDCAEGVCAHEDAVDCYGPNPAAVCLACSILAGSWAGELEGMVSIPVAACGVLPAVAAHYEVMS
ncbi:hypothetical protein [Lentzea sp. NPDC092896]|uniref:hypothetical protein n=1 Tax=Lentzea sp. NPDC092896 TaxID=3364127 RepID=UPI00382345AF